MESKLPQRRVRVRYAKGPRILADSLDGWSYEFTDAETGQNLGGGWSAGKKHDAIADARETARNYGWVV